MRGRAIRKRGALAPDTLKTLEHPRAVLAIALAKRPDLRPKRTQKLELRPEAFDMMPPLAGIALDMQAILTVADRTRERDPHIAIFC